MAANPREAERALPSVEREAELRELVEAAIEAEARHADTYRKPAWECKNDAENRDAARRALFALIDAARAELDALRAENSRLRAVVASLQWPDGGRAPVSRLDPEVM